MTDPAAIDPRGPSQRLLFLDIARAAAIAMMVFAHFADQLLDPVVRASPLGALYGVTRGFTAPMFFVVSGWTFAAVVLRRVLVGDKSPDFPRRLRRAGLLLLFGYALTLPWWAEGFPFSAAPEVWVPFWTAGVLQSLAIALAVATLILWWVRVPWAFVGLSALLAVLLVVAAPWTHALAAQWPPAVRGFFDPRTVPGGFPIAPWSGHFFAGAALGGAFLITQVGRWKRAGVLALMAVGAALVQAGLAAPHKLIVYRFAWVAGALALTVALAPTAGRLPLVLRILSAHALTFYVVHMVVLWGAPFVPGLVWRIGPQLGWVECAALTAICLLVTGAGIRLASAVAQRQRSSSQLGDAANAARISPT